MKMRDAENSECRKRLKSTSREIQFEKGRLLQDLPGVRKVISNSSCRKLVERAPKKQETNVNPDFRCTIPMNIFVYDWA